MPALSPRAVAALCLAVTAALLPGLGAAASASASEATTNGDGSITITWPTGPVLVGSAASVTVSAAGVAGPVEVELSDDDYDTVAQAVLTTASPSVTLGLDTSTVGTVGYYVEATEVDVPYDEISWATSDHALEVVGRPTTLTASFPRAVTVKPGAKAGTITGTVDRPGAVVSVQARPTGGDWATIATTRASGTGTYAVGVPTFWVGRHQLRTLVAADAASTEAASPTSGAVTVTRTKPLRGSSRYSLMFPKGIRWNPCEPVTYRLNRARMPRSGPAVVRRSLAAVAQETGLRFTYVGTTAHTPFARRRVAGVREEDTDIVFAWATESVVPQLRGSTVGVGGSSYSSLGGGLQEGGVVVEAGKVSSGPSGFDLMLHELGHAIGLGHTTDRLHIMHSGLSRVPLNRWGRGDTVGLGKVGAAAGCVAPEDDGWNRPATSRPTAAPTTPVTTVVLP